MSTSNNFNDTLASLFVGESRIPEEFRIEELHQREYLVNGEMRKWDGAVSEVYSPIMIPTSEGLKRKLIGSYPIGTGKEANEALEAAIAAYDNGRGEWPSMSVQERVKCLEKFVYKMGEQRTLVVNLIMWEIGKSYADSAKEFDRTVEYINNTIDALKDIDRQSSRFEIKEGVVAQVRRTPLGVVLCMGPFNYPLNETYTTLIPAILMGNTILFKPPKHGTLVHYPLLKAFQECFPKGVVNTVYGRGADVTPALMESGKVNVLAFIGSSKVANDLKKRHPKINRLRAVLSLDAKNAAIVTQDADIKLAVNECILGSLSYNGQRCTAIKIIYVHQSIADKFNQELSAAISKMKFGLPWEKGVQLTPVAEPGKPGYLQECIEDAKANGASVINDNGGATAGSFVYPAVVYPVNSAMKLYREEQFGPVIPVIPYNDIEEAIDYIVESPHGQQVSVFSNNSQEVAGLIDILVTQVGRVNINAQCQRGPDDFPFTGRKDSAEGTLSVADALRAFSIRSIVATKMNDSNKKILNSIVKGHESNFLSTDFIF
ncbi:NADP-dependent glyceraldehyde-3-phosphate dehydrogenase [Polluticaenibacter yanchengensis]|uniref:NADP-dependent glyceraldehyde-3-phosphate dehydrogenase n=1 Tax=Polluticaenibacter yanchengensis TaxID=3014562 RepID=A0ABT4ULZ9_9BACT|nr:NADP-dependent glyceraldehyde-3-phosphate dehydrogenase [Chitinophagaceae bacterium LY-5]